MYAETDFFLPYIYIYIYRGARFRHLRLGFTNNRVGNLFRVFQIYPSLKEEGSVLGGGTQRVTRWVNEWGNERACN